MRIKVSDKSYRSTKVQSYHLNVVGVLCFFHRIVFGEQFSTLLRVLSQRYQNFRPFLFHFPIQSAHFYRVIRHAGPTKIEKNTMAFN